MTAVNDTRAPATSGVQGTGVPVLIDRDVAIAMRDGTVLRADVWRPQDGEAHPAIVYRTPYDRRSLSLDTLRPQQAVAAGYAAVVQDTRGRFGSEGEWKAIMWADEGDDTYDTVEWTAAQPWCDGAVGMVGTSYLGIVQLLGAARRPPHLRAIAPCMATTSALELAETGGCFRLEHVITWLTFMAAEWLQREYAAGRMPDPGVVSRVMSLIADPTPGLWHLPLRDIPQLRIPGFPVDMEQLLSEEVRTSADVDFEDITVPTLAVGGWYDVFSRATVETFLQLRRSGGGGAAVRSAHRLLMGPWAHSGPLLTYQGEMNMGLQAGAVVGRIPEHHIAFFDRHLRDRDAVDEPAVRYYLLGANTWQTADDWPPADTRIEEWHLRSTGRLDRDPAVAGEPSDTYTYDPADPAPAHGGRVLYLGTLVGGPMNQAHIEARSDVVTYTSPPLGADTDVVGHVLLELHAASDARDTDFVARLTDVHRDGRSVLVCDGALRARFRHGPDAEHLLEPGAIETYRIDLGHTAWRVPAGHRIRISVTSSLFPHFDRNLNTGNPLGTDATGVVAHQSLHHSAEHPSRLLLPVLPDQQSRSTQ